MLTNDVIAVSAGHLILTTTERNALTSPATGTEIFNTTTGAFEVYTGATWQISRPFRMESGTATVTTSLSIATGPFTNGFYNIAAITFTSNRFTQAPIVTASAGTSNACFSWVSAAPTTSGISIGVVGETNTSHTIRWTAVQMTSGSASG